MSEKIRLKIKKLVNQINIWNEEYFDNDNPTVSDRVYDSHLKELVKLEKQYPEYVLENTPTKKIGANSAKTKFKKVVHEKPMLSLNKAYDFEELKKFFNDIYIITNKQHKYLIQPKIDGLSISLKYKNGKFIQAITRGDGSVGEDVTLNVKNVISGIPESIIETREIEFRGEIYISKSNFEKVIKEENVEFANARNLASGTLRQLNSDIVKRRNLSVFIYDIVDAEKYNIKTQEELVKYLKINNFPFINDYIIESTNNIENIFNYITNFENLKRNNLDFDIDGMVIKLNEMEDYEEIGYTSKFPKYAIAYKFNEEIVQTILENIFITIGRTGVVTYNAKLKKVLLNGTMVSAATLHNYNYVEELNINIGDEVSIKKAGEIIPKVVSLSKKKSSGVFQKIIKCPHCYSNLVDTKTQNNQLCINENCPEINIKKIIHFTSKQGLDIDGLGEGIIRKFYELKFIQKIEDIFILDKYHDQIINEKGFGDKFWKNLKDGIKESYKVKIDKLIFALGIPQLGAKNAKAIAKKIKIFENIKNVSIDDLIAIKDIGDITIHEFNKYLNNENNIKLVDYLVSIGINPAFEIDNNNIIDFFNNKTFVISGTFDISRNEITKLIENSGGNVSSSISKNTFALILGENAGSKVEKAKKLGIRIIERDEFYSIIKKIK